MQSITALGPEMILNSRCYTDNLPSIVTDSQTNAFSITVLMPNKFTNIFQNHEIQNKMSDWNSGQKELGS